MSERQHKLIEVPGIGATRKNRLREAGYTTVSDIASATQEELTTIKSIHPDMARCVQQGAKELLGEDDTIQNKIATECGVRRKAVAEAFSEIAYRGGSFDMKKTALREVFCDETADSILTLDGHSLRYLFLLYKADFRTREAVAKASISDLAAVNYFDKQRAQEFKTAAREATEEITDRSSVDKSNGKISENEFTSDSGDNPTLSNTDQQRESQHSTARVTQSKNEQSPVESPSVESSSEIPKTDALDLLKESLSPDATFRPDQWEAINRLVNNEEQLLLVQRTGWGKSTVYFIATKLLRAQGAGPTLIISPLLSLMRNQIKNAEDSLNLDAITINSNNTEEWDVAKQAVVNGDCDLLLISPERLSNPEFQEDVLSEMEQDFGMLVVDEAHCISDWGHEFRPDYRRIKPIIERLPDTTPVAATTATANDRVVADITTQLPHLDPIRGKLVRDSLKIQAIELTSREERLAWLAENVTETPVSGIIYCLTTDDTEEVAEWLADHGLDVLPYHGQLDDETRREREQRLLDNDVDGLVATNALGMGFNKPDLGFVIHFQRPPDLIRYYQEIGRAGRDLDEAYAVLLAGEEDDDIAEYFIENAFPAPKDFEMVISVIEESEEALSKREIKDQTGMKWRRMNKCIDILSVEDAITSVNKGYVRTQTEWTYDHDRVEKVTDRRWEELNRIKEFVTTDQCLTLYIDGELDGNLDEPCGQCANCVGNFLPTSVQNEGLIQQAAERF